MIVFFLSALFFLSVVWGIWGFRKHDSWEVWQRWLCALLPLMSFLLFLLYLNHSIHILNNFWNGARLAFSAAILNGYKLYYPPNQGPILGMMYGPLAPLLWMPAMLLKSISMQIVVASWITYFIIITPMFVLVMRNNWRDSFSRVHAFGCILLAISLLYAIPSMKYITTWVHVDSVAVSLGLLSCIFLMALSSEPGWLRTVLSAVFAVAAALAKQNEALIVGAHIIYVWGAFGKRALIRYVVSLATVSACLMLLAVVFFYDLIQPFIFNALIVPSNHPPEDGSLWFIIELAVTVTVQYSFLVVWIGWLLALDGDMTLWWRDRKTWKDTSAWMLPMLAALFLFPISILGDRKIGGDINSHHFVYYLIAALVWIMANPAKRSRHGSLPPRKGLVLLSLLIVFAFLPYNELSYKMCARIFRENPQQQVFEFMRRHPGEVYAPWYPLPALDAEGKLYHFSDGILSLYLAGYHVKQRHFEAFLPEKIRYVIFREGDCPIQEDHTLRYLHGFRKPKRMKELPGWIVLTRNN